MSEQQPARDELLDTNYDGIRECDNDLPQWFFMLFVATIAFGIFYVIYRNAFAGVTAPEILEARLRDSEVRAAKAEDEAAPALTEEDLRAFLADSEALRAGRGVFAARCMPCHGQNGEGGIGPNLTDQYWLHGGGIADIRHTIEAGVLEKGMLAWKGVLRGDEIGKVTAYVKSIGGSNPANAKAPQGTLVEQEELDGKPASGASSG